MQVGNRGGCGILHLVGVLQVPHQLLPGACVGCSAELADGANCFLNFLQLLSQGFLVRSLLSIIATGASKSDTR